MRRRFGRFGNVALIGGLVLALVGVCFTFFLQGGTSALTSQRVLVASHELSAGTVLASSDLRAINMQADDATLQLFVLASQQRQVIGRTLVQGLASGQPLVVAAVAAAGNSGGTRTIPISFKYAPGLSDGQVIDIWEIGSAGAGGSSARLLLPSIPVHRSGNAWAITVPVSEAGAMVFFTTQATLEAVPVGSGGSVADQAPIANEADARRQLSSH